MRWWHLAIGVAFITAVVLATMGLYRRYISKGGCQCSELSKADVTPLFAGTRSEGGVIGMGGKKVF